MFACVHARQGAAALPILAALFSPEAEQVGPATIVFSIKGLRRLIGGVNEIASAISARGMELNITGNLSIAAQPDTAILGARHLPGVSLIEPGREIEQLGRILVAAATEDAALVKTLDRWGVRTLGELAALPPIGVMERLGEPADTLRRLALGMVSRPLRLDRPASGYAASLDFEDPLRTVEEVVAALTPPLERLTAEAASQGHAVRSIELTFTLARGVTRESVEQRVLPLPVPTGSVAVLLKQLQLNLEAHPLAAPVKRLEFQLEPASPRTLQGGLYLPPAPAPDRLEDVLQRIAALVGPENVGSPEVLDTHRPDAHAIRRYQLSPGDALVRTTAVADLRLAFRYFRPALTARVEMRADRPVRLAAPKDSPAKRSAAAESLPALRVPSHPLPARQVEGHVTAAAGPWRSSGEWWAETAWSREEWDVALSGGGLYRIYLDLVGHAWFVEGMYD